MTPLRLSAGVIVVSWLNDQPHYLLLRVYNYWGFPKGEVEREEQPLKAAEREVEEETCLKTLQFRWGEDYRETPPYGNGKVARYYVAESPDGKVFLCIAFLQWALPRRDLRWAGFRKVCRQVCRRIAHRMRELSDKGWEIQPLVQGDPTSWGMEQGEKSGHEWKLKVFVCQRRAVSGPFSANGGESGNPTVAT